MKLLYFANEVGNGESNIKKNMELVKMASLVNPDTGNPYNF